MAKQRLFYAPVGQPPIELKGRKFRSPANGKEFHNPKVNLQENILALQAEPTLPDGDVYTYTVSYERSGNNVVANVTSLKRDATLVYREKVQELKAKALEEAKVLPGGYDSDGLDAVLVHLASGEPGPFDVPKKNGTWGTLSLGQLRTAMDNLSARYSLVKTAAEAHLTALQALRDADDVRGVLDYDLEASWPP